MNGCLWNCRSAFYKLPFISQLFSDKELDFLMLSETWHAKSMPGKLDVFNATFLDYTKAEDLDVAILSKARGSGKRGGGVAFIFQASLNFTIYAIVLAEPTSFEYLSCKRKGVSPVVIVVIYRPPSVSFVTFLLEFERLLLALSDMTHPWIIAGDFNIKITDDTNHNTISFGNLISDYNCGLGLPNQPTHSGGNTLDFAVFSEDMSSRCSSLSVDNNESPSDHFPVLFKVDHPSTHSAGSYEYRKYNGIEILEPLMPVISSLTFTTNFLLFLKTMSPGFLAIFRSITIYSLVFLMIMLLYCPHYNQILDLLGLIMSTDLLELYAIV